MNKKKIILIAFFLSPLFFLGKISLDLIAVSAANTTINITSKIAICGNNAKEVDEDCDGLDLTNKNCQSFGYRYGTLSCSPSCDFNLSSCSQDEPPINYGGNPVSETKVFFRGIAYPQSNVVLMKDGQIASKAVSGSKGEFSMEVSGLSGGNYIFNIYAIDDKGITSSSFVFPLKVIQGETMTIDDVLLAPTIAIDKNEVKKGDDIIVSGQSSPQNDVLIFIDLVNQVTVTSDSRGSYSYSFNTASLAENDYYIRAKSVKGESYSKSVKFIVGDSNVPVSDKSLKGDLNNDGKVNLVDFSIAAYWYDKDITPSFSKVEGQRLNDDGRINLVDFSIIAFYWNG